MALAVGVVPPYAKLERRGDDRVTISVDHAGLESFLGVSETQTLHRTKDELPAEIDKDLPPWADTAIEVAVRMSSSPRFPRGRFMSAKIHVMHPPVAEMEARVAGSATWLAPVRTSVPGWEAKPPRPRSSRAPARRPLPAPISDVAYIPEPQVYVPPAPSTEKLNSDEDVPF